MTVINRAPLLIRRPTICDGRVNAEIDGQWWVLNCALSGNHQGKHRGDLGGGLTKTWSDDDGWRGGDVAL